LESGLGAAVPTSVPPDWPPEADPEFPPFPAKPLNCPKLGRGRGEISGVESPSPLVAVPHQPPDPPMLPK
jgi:hypothetical protein